MRRSIRGWTPSSRSSNRWPSTASTRAARSATALLNSFAVSALDVSIQPQVVNLLIELRQELGLSYLFIGHDMGVVERSSHRVAVMQHGRIVEMGTRAQIFEAPSQACARALIAAAPVADPGRNSTKGSLASSRKLLTP